MFFIPWHTIRTAAHLSTWVVPVVVRLGESFPRDRWMDGCDGLQIVRKDAQSSLRAGGIRL